MDEVGPEVRDMLEKFSLKSEANVVEENQMLMHLAHVTNVGHDWEVEDLCEEAHSEELAHARNSRAVDLDERQRIGFHEVLEQHPICDVLAGGNLERADGTRQLHMGLDVIRVCRFFDPVRAEFSEFATNAKSIWERPVLVRIEHQRAFIADQIAQHSRATQVPTFFGRADLKLERGEALV